MYDDLEPGLTPEQQAYKEAVHHFAAKVLRPASAALDRLVDPGAVIEAESALWPALHQAWRLGYHRAMLPAELGGVSAVEQHILLEEMGWGAADLALGIVLAGFPAVVVAQTGNPDLIGEFARPFAEDTAARRIGCWAISEPEHGSDAVLLGTPEFVDPRLSAESIARRDRDCYVLNGAKAAWVSNGSIATHALMFLSLDPGRGMAGGGVAIVPLHVRGVSRGKPLDKMGQRALNQGEIRFEEVRIPERYMITDPTLYAFFLDRTLALASVSMAAVFTGAARAAYEAALAHTKTRVQGGKPLCEHQLVQKRLFDMFARVEACRALSRAALVHNHAMVPPPTEHAIAAKTFCTEAAFEVVSSALQLFGGGGLEREHPIEKLFRDARASLLEHGSNDVLALVAARRLLERRPGSAVRRGAATA